MFPEEVNPVRTGLLLSTDLFFTSKVTGTARQLGYDVQLVTTVAAVLERLNPASRSMEGGSAPCGALFIDLGHPTTDLRALVDAAHAHQPPVSVVAFGQHVATDRLEQARLAGCDDVMPRGRFSAQLVEILRGVLGPLKDPAEGSDATETPAAGETA